MFEGIGRLSLNVLEQRAAEGNIGYLHTATDGEGGKVAFRCTASETEFELVAERIDGVDGLVRNPAIRPRVDVTAPGEQQPIDAIEKCFDLGCGAGRKYDRNAAYLADQSCVGRVQNMSPGFPGR